MANTSTHLFNSTQYKFDKHPGPDILPTGNGDVNVTGTHTYLVFSPAQTTVITPYDRCYYLTDLDLQETTTYLRLPCGRVACNSITCLLNLVHSGRGAKAHDIDLVFVTGGTRIPWAGNAAWLLAMKVQGWRMKFAPTMDVVKAFREEARKQQDGRVVNGVPGMEEILMVHGCSVDKKMPLDYEKLIVAKQLYFGNKRNNVHCGMMANQIWWTEERGPWSTATLEPSVAHDDWSSVPELQEEDGSVVVGKNGRALRDFDHILPRQISSGVKGFYIAMWCLEDPRIEVMDILERFERPTSGKKNQGAVKAECNRMRQMARRWRQKHHVLSPVWKLNKAAVQRPDHKAVLGLCAEQRAYNTGWAISLETIGGSLVHVIVSPADVHEVRPLCYGFPASHSSTGWGVESPRVRAIVRAIAAVEGEGVETEEDEGAESGGGVSDEDVDEL